MGLTCEALWPVIASTSLENNLKLHSMVSRHFALVLSLLFDLCPLMIVRYELPILEEWCLMWLRYSLAFLKSPKLFPHCCLFTGKCEMLLNKV